MKFINKLLVLGGLLIFSMGCENTELDLLDNPNAVTPERASLNDLYNSIQLTFRNIYSGAQGNPGQLARMYQVTAFTYTAASTQNTLNGTWNNVYAALFPDIDALLAIAEPQGFDIHAGTAKIMKAYTMMVMVDLLGKVPFSDAIKGTDVISPTEDEGESVYAAALTLIDEAIAQLSGTNAAAPTTDNFYGGSAAKWVTFANTLKLRAALTTRLVDGSAASTINALVAAGDIIDEASEDFQFTYGTQRTNPNSRHPWYNSMYELADGPYQSNYYMWLLAGEKETVDGVDIFDPRIRYYWYRKVDDASNQDATTYSCIGGAALPDQDSKPAHWSDVDPEIPYCVIPNSGYSGRDFLNGSGTPPDGPVKTSYGLYPAGGAFDDDTFNDTRLLGTTGGLGGGIWPIMLSSFVDFMRGEAALTIKTNDDPRALLESGIRKSMAKTISFESLVPATMGQTVTLRDGSSGTVKDLFGANQDDIDKYVTDVLALYDAATTDDERLDVLIKEYYIALWGNGLEAYNMWRRTGLPSNMAPSVEVDPGPFARSLLYPVDHITRNANATQKSLTDQVFWDDGSAVLY